MQRKSRKSINLSSYLGYKSENMKSGNKMEASIVKDKEALSKKMIFSVGWWIWSKNVDSEKKKRGER